MGAVLTLESVMQCPHGGVIEFPDLLIHGFPVLRPSDVAMVQACANQSSDGSPAPCTLVLWSGSVGIYEGEGVLTTDSVGMCSDMSGAPAGPVSILSTQSEVTA
jgi:hypothetical protein